MKNSNRLTNNRKLIMEILSIIPARGGSKEIPMKNLVKLNRKPLIYYTIRASLNSKKVSRTIVSTDNKKIEEVAKKIGAEVVIRPKRLANDKAAIEPTIEHVLKILKNKENYVPDILVLLQNTSPLRSAKHIDEAIELLLNKKYHSVLSCNPTHKFLWSSKGNQAHPINYNPNKRQNRQEIKNQFIENGAIYITKISSFNKTKCRISGKIGVYPMPEDLSIEIDTELDLDLINQKMKKIRND